MLSDPGRGFAYASVSDSYVATWKENAKAAYSLSSDDCHPSEVYTIAPALTERGLHGTFYVNPGPNNWPWNFFANVGDVNGDGKPDGWLHLPEQGHELAGHTLYHYSVVHGLASPGNPNGTFATYDDLNADLVQTNSIIQNLTGQRVVSFAYPYGYFDAPSEAVVMQNYLSARSLIHEYPLPGTNTFVPNPATPADMGALYCFYVEGIQPGTNFTNYNQASASFAKMLSDTVAAGGWGIEFFHQTGDDYTNSYYGDFSNIDRNAYYEHLDRIVSNVQSGTVWEDTVGNVTRYIDSRNAATITYDSNSSAAIQLRVNDNLDHSLFNEPLTINTLIPTDWAASLSITDNGQPVAFKTFVDSGSGATYATYDVIADGSRDRAVPQFGESYLSTRRLQPGRHRGCGRLHRLARFAWIV